MILVLLGVDIVLEENLNIIVHLVVDIFTQETADDGDSLYLSIMSFVKMKRYSLQN